MKKTLCFALLLAALPGSLSAQILVQYNFNLNNNGTAFNATTVGTGVSATAVSQVGFASVSSSTDVADSGRQRAITLDQIDDTFATADYYEFTLTPTNPGEALALANLTFYFNISAVEASANSRYQLQYDDLADGAGFVTVGTTVYATTNSKPGLFADFDLSGGAFSNLTEGITFRLDVEDSGNENSNRSVRLDTLTVNAVPEPSSVAILLGGLGGLVGFRRSRRRG